MRARDGRRSTKDRPLPPFRHCSARTPSTITTTPPNLPFRRGGVRTSPALRAPSPNLGEAKLPFCTSGTPPN